MIVWLICSSVLDFGLLLLVCICFICSSDFFFSSFIDGFFWTGGIGINLKTIRKTERLSFHLYFDVFCLCVLYFYILFWSIVRCLYYCNCYLFNDVSNYHVILFLNIVKSIKRSNERWMFFFQNIGKFITYYKRQANKRVIH